MESRMAVSIAGPDARQLQESLATSLRGAGLHLDPTTPPATAATERGGDLPLWFAAVTALVSSSVDVTSLVSFFMDLGDRRKRSAAKQSQDIELAKKFLDEVAQHGNLAAEVVLHDRQSGRVLRISSGTSAADVDKFRSEALQQESADE